MFLPGFACAATPNLQAEGFPPCVTSVLGSVDLATLVSPHEPETVDDTFYPLPMLTSTATDCHPSPYYKTLGEAAAIYLIKFRFPDTTPELQLKVLDKLIRIMDSKDLSNPEDLENYASFITAANEANTRLITIYSNKRTELLQSTSAASTPETVGKRRSRSADAEDANDQPSATKVFVPGTGSSETDVIAD